MAPLDLSKNAADVVAAAKDATPEDRAAALVEEQSKSSPRKTVVDALQPDAGGPADAPGDTPPAPGEVRAPNVAPVDQGAADPNPTPSATPTDLGAADRSQVDLKKFVGSTNAPSDLYLVLDDVRGEHYFADKPEEGKGAQILAVKGQAVDDGISKRIDAAVKDLAAAKAAQG